MDDGFAVYESAVIVEYLEDRFPSDTQRPFPADIKARATARRLIREADEYAARALETMVDQILFMPREQWREDVIRAGADAFIAELERFEAYLPAEKFLAGVVSAADFTVYPLVALALRLERRKADLGIKSALGPKLSAWMQRIEALPYFARTYPPHWKQG